jgi:hypothetical protein
LFSWLSPVSSKATAYACAVAFCLFFSDHLACFVCMVQEEKVFRKSVAYGVGFYVKSAQLL